MKKDDSTRDDVEFNAYAYAKDFEKLSLEIVRIISKEKIGIDEIKHADTTQTTRDFGVDAYLIIKVHGECLTYTVEAKLRTTKTLSLRDFATSILYYLINTSSKHFIITNISYSSEAQKYIKQLNTTNEKLVELIDGKILQKIINRNLEIFYSYPTELLEYILNRRFEQNDTSVIDIREENVKNHIIPLECYEELIDNAKSSYEQGNNVFLVTGMSGTGKSTWIELYLSKNFHEYAIYKLDLAIIQTPRLLVLELLHLLLGFDIEKLIMELEKEEYDLGDVFEQNQIFHSYTEQIVNALKLLLIEKDLHIDTYIYMMKLLIEHLYKHFLLHTNIVLIIDNLQESSLEMINFTINTMYCFGQKNTIIFWEILLPSNSKQLTNTTIEQWYSFLQALENRKYVQKHKAYKIGMPILSEDDIIEIIENTIPDINFTDEFIQKFVDYFGTNVRTVFDALGFIKQNKLYSAISLNKIHLGLPILIENQINELVNSQNRNEMFYNWVFQLCQLLEGKLYAPIIEFLDKKFKVNTRLLLLESGLFLAKNQTLVFAYWNHKEILSKFSNSTIKRTCAEWLKAHLSDLYYNSITTLYLDVFLTTIIAPSDAIAKVNDTIPFFYKNQIFKYVLILAEFRYTYYKDRGASLDCYRYFVEYISYLRKATTHREEVVSQINKAIRMRDNLFWDYRYDKQYIKTNIELALIQYHIAKANYEYENCEKYIKYVLSYEDTIEDKEPFTLARIYYALNKKEYGSRKEFIIELVNNCKRYPNNVEVKISYYINLAAMYKFDNIDLAIKLLRIAQTISYNMQYDIGDLEVETNLLHMLCHKGELSHNQIMHIRLIAEKTNSTYNLAKTFNVEACFYAQNSSEKTSSVEECLRTAVFHSLSSGQTKQSFLFRLNLITILLIHKADCYEEFYMALEWFEKNQIMILKRLKRNPYKNNDHMFVALISLLFISKKLEVIDLIKSKTQIYDFFPALKCMSLRELLEQVPEYYKIECVNRTSQKETAIFMLF